MWKAIYPFLIVFVIGMLIGAGLYHSAIRGDGDSDQLVESLEAEIRERDQLLDGIQGAVSSVGIGIGDAANETGRIAGGVSGIVLGLDNSINLLWELPGVIEQIIEILKSREIPDAP